MLLVRCSGKFDSRDNPFSFLGEKVGIPWIQPTTNYNPLKKKPISKPLTEFGVLVVKESGETHRGWTFHLTVPL